MWVGAHATAHMCRSQDNFLYVGGSLSGSLPPCHGLWGETLHTEPSVWPESNVYVIKQYVFTRMMAKVTGEALHLFKESLLPGRREAATWHVWLSWVFLRKQNVLRDPEAGLRQSGRKSN